MAERSYCRNHSYMHRHSVRDPTVTRGQYGQQQIQRGDSDGESYDHDRCTQFTPLSTRRYHQGYASVYSPRHNVNSVRAFCRVCIWPLALFLSCVVCKGLSSCMLTIPKRLGAAIRESDHIVLPILRESCAPMLMIF